MPVKTIILLPMPQSFLDTPWQEDDYEEQTELAMERLWCLKPARLKEQRLKLITLEKSQAKFADARRDCQGDPDKPARCRMTPSKSVLVPPRTAKRSPPERKEKRKMFQDRVKISVESGHGGSGAYPPKVRPGDRWWRRRNGGVILYNQQRIENLKFQPQERARRQWRGQKMHGANAPTAARHQSERWF